MSSTMYMNIIYTYTTSWSILKDKSVVPCMQWQLLWVAQYCVNPVFFTLTSNRMISPFLHFLSLFPLSQSQSLTQNISMLHETESQKAWICWDHKIKNNKHPLNSLFHIHVYQNMVRKWNYCCVNWSKAVVIFYQDGFLGLWQNTIYAYILHTYNYIFVLI